MQTLHKHFNKVWLGRMRTCVNIATHPRRDSSTSDIDSASPHQRKLPARCSASVRPAARVGPGLGRHPVFEIRDPTARAGPGCQEQVATLRLLIEAAERYKDGPLAFTFIDFKKAFDSIDRPYLLSALRYFRLAPT